MATARKKIYSERERVRNVALANERLFRRVVPAARGGAPSGSPHWTQRGGVLQAEPEWRRAVDELRRLGLEPHPDGPKNWDALAALATVLDSTDRSEAVLDAGATFYSPLLYWLFRYGYRNLTSVNLEFQSEVMRGPIRYLPGDLTAMPFDAGSFGAVTCLSVIEHGVDVERALAEFARVLKPGGRLVISSDYWCAPMDTAGLEAYGTAVRIFSRQDMESLIETAGGFGLDPILPIDLDCSDRPVHWERVDLRFTFSLASFTRR